LKKIRGVQITEDAEISIQYRLLEARKSVSTYPSELVKYPLSLYIGEAVRTDPESAFLPFMVALESKPEVASFKIRGEVYVKGPSQTVEGLVLPEDGRPPKVWSFVYHNILGVVSKLAKHLEVAIPREPWLNES